MNEIQFPTSESKGLSIYAVVSRPADNQYLLATGSLESYQVANWGSYTLSLVPSVDGDYLQASLPTTTPTGSYTVTLYEQAGATPATTDSYVASDTLRWCSTPSAAAGFDALALRAAIVSCTGPGSELVTITQGGVPRSIRALVFREGGVTFDGHMGFSLMVAIANDPVVGITTVNHGQDSITVSPRLGEAARSYKITNIDPETDPYTWYFRLNVK